MKLSGKREKTIKKGPPPVIGLSSVLTNIYLADLDREVEKRFPSVNYFRFESEVFLYERKESPSLERKAFVKFLLEFDLTSTFQETGTSNELFIRISFH